MTFENINTMTTRHIAAATVLLAAAFVPVTNADIINVPGDEPTIQSAIDFAVNGDEVVVAEGTYLEAINFLGKAITVRSTDPMDPVVVAATIIDGTGYLHVVQCVSSEGPDTVLDGLTITGGNADGVVHSDLVGGGMYNDGSDPTVTNCTFSGNSAARGGGMSNESGSSPTVTNCTFIGNGGSSVGGGMVNANNSDATVTNCTFSGNSADSGNAGGMWNSSSSPTVTNCTFEGNTAAHSGGGMLNTGNSSPTVTNCTFSENSALQGGGMWNSSNSPTVTNCTFSGNSATVHGGGGMYNASGFPTVTNCTFSGNSAGDQGGGGMFNQTAIPMVTNCISWGNSPNEIVGPGTVAYSDVQGGIGGPGNIDADPLFVDPANGDLRLSAGSPAIDAGNNWGVTQDTADVDDDGDVRELTPLDLDGNPRLADDPAAVDTGCGVPAVVDMGAHEFQGVPAPNSIYLGDIDMDGIVGIVDFLAMLADWGPCVEDCCLADLDLDGDVGITDFELLLGNWTA